MSATMRVQGAVQGADPEQLNSNLSIVFISNVIDQIGRRDLWRLRLVVVEVIFVVEVAIIPNFMIWCFHQLRIRHRVIGSPT